MAPRSPHTGPGMTQRSVSSPTGAYGAAVGTGGVGSDAESHFGVSVALPMLNLGVTSCHHHGPVGQRDAGVCGDVWGGIRGHPPCRLWVGSCAGTWLRWQLPSPWHHGARGLTPRRHPLGARRHPPSVSAAVPCRIRPQPLLPPGLIRCGYPMSSGLATGASRGPGGAGGGYRVTQPWPPGATRSPNTERPLVKLKKSPTIPAGRLLQQRLRPRNQIPEAGNGRC